MFLIGTERATAMAQVVELASRRRNRSTAVNSKVQPRRQRLKLSVQFGSLNWTRTALSEWLSRRAPTA